MADSEQVVIDLIDGNDGWVEDTNLFRGQLYGDEDAGAVVPRQAVFVSVTGGPQPENVNGTLGGLQLRTFDIQVIIRGLPDSYGGTRIKAQTIYDLIHDKAPSGWTYLRAATPVPQPLGQDERRSHLFVINLELTGLA